MWWDYQNLNAPRTDKKGRKWNFRVWHEVLTLGRTVTVARVFYWNERRQHTGVVLLRPDVNQHVRDIHRLIEKLVASEELRLRHQRELRFPLDRFYSDYAVFPEEQNVLTELRAEVEAERSGR